VGCSCFTDVAGRADAARQTGGIVLAVLARWAGRGRAALIGAELARAAHAPIAEVKFLGTWHRRLRLACADKALGAGLCRVSERPVSAGVGSRAIGALLLTAQVRQVIGECAVCADRADALEVVTRTVMAGRTVDRFSVLSAVLASIAGRAYSVA
jgi:hypothetical protein